MWKACTAKDVRRWGKDLTNFFGRFKQRIDARMLATDTSKLSPETVTIAPFSASLNTA